jgi:hypothetical protein
MNTKFHDTLFSFRKDSIYSDFNSMFFSFSSFIYTVSRFNFFI